MATAARSPAVRAPAPRQPGLFPAGELHLLSDPDRLLEGADATLRRLRRRTRADAAELFLLAPGADELFLISHQGDDIEAFCQHDRFRVGEGFPGLAVRAGRPVRSSHLETENDFLRSRVKALRYRSAVCVPFTARGQTGGALFFAWRSPDADLERAVHLGLLAASPVGLAIELAHARLHLRALRETATRPEPTQDGTGWARLPAAHASSTLTALKTRTAARPAPVVPVEGDARCPAEGGCLQVCGGRSGWPRPCLRAGCVAAARYCVPLRSGDSVWGVASVTFRDRAPLPLTRFLPVTLWQTEGLAAAASPAPTAVPAAGSAPAGRLEIRCFGGFEVWREGRLLRRADFGRAKCRELFALLVEAGGRPLSASRLATALWPEASPAQAKNRFHVTLSTLRRAIEPRNRKRWTHVRCDGRAYFLDPRSSVRVDLWRFDELTRQVRASAGRGAQGGTRPTVLQEAAALHVGDAFEGEFVASWADAAARRRRAALLHVLEQLTPTPDRSNGDSPPSTTPRRA